MDQVREPDKGKPRDRVLNHDEIRLIYIACLEWEAEVLEELSRVAAGGKRITSGRTPSVDFPRIAMLCFLTGCRPQEIADMKWSWLDFEHGALMIPKDFYKTGVDVEFPLCDTAMKILRSIKPIPGREYVFGSPGNRGRTSTGVGQGCDATTLGKKLRSRIATAGAPAIDRDVEIRVREMLANGVPTYRIRSQAHVGWGTLKQVEARVAAGTPVPEPQTNVMDHWQIRDIRRTFSTTFREVPGISDDIVERLIGHLVGKPIERIYNKFDYWAQKREAIGKWDAYFHAIVDGSVKKIERPTFGRRSAA
jgi:integrase